MLLSLIRWLAEGRFEMSNLQVQAGRLHHKLAANKQCGTSLWPFLTRHGKAH